MKGTMKTLVGNENEKCKWNGEVNVNGLKKEMGMEEMEKNKKKRKKGGE